MKHFLDNISFYNIFDIFMVGKNEQQLKKASCVRKYNYVQAW
jgi:hypothetical protein